MKKRKQFTAFFAFVLCASTSFGAEHGTTDATKLPNPAPMKTQPPSSGSTTDKSSEKELDKNKKDEEIDSNGRVFGYRNGYVHLALGLNEEWTDNLYNQNKEKQDNYLTRVTPSVWFTWPRRSRRPLQIALDNTATGGTQYSQTAYEVFNKYQVYLGGNLDFLRYSADSDLNHTESGFEGLVMYQPGGRLTLRMLDKYNLSQDIFNITEATQENDRAYDSNMFSFGGEWEFFDKFAFRLDYKNFLLQYQDGRNTFMDREDNGFDAALSYKYSPKTSFFLNYQYLLAGYDERKMPDNSNTYIDAGINWQATVKTSFMFKTGYQHISYDYEGTEYGMPESLRSDSESGMDFEAQYIWQATQKSNLLLNAKYNIEQSDSKHALNKAVFAGRVGFDYRVTDRLRGGVNLVYENSDYVQFVGDDRLDDRWYLRPELQYAVVKWLSVSIYFSIDNKDSNFDELDYESRAVGIGLRGSI
ncbi:outer membrane beta-barrel protein [Desulfobulbus sp. F4]|nr:outer membrane beta-barrel protein [Desulfobulbus sp. F3]MCW5200366.1 outer membrane beta-barrel protein [Desulfobulbus sp. F4]